jgi:hypothetical protein
LDDTAETSATFNGQSGSRYQFYSIATDLVGHREAAPVAADATTTVQGNHPADLNGDGVVTSADVDALCDAIRNNGGATFDLNRDGIVDRDDQRFMIANLIGTTYGDANLDGIFNSTDLVLVFVAGEYEDDVPGNSGWAEGDWNCDGDFGTGDLVAAFTAGGYVAAALMGSVDPPAIAGAISPLETNALPLDHPSPQRQSLGRFLLNRPIGKRAVDRHRDARDLIFNDWDPQILVRPIHHGDHGGTQWEDDADFSV